MDMKPIITDALVALYLSGEEPIDPDSARALVREARRSGGLDGWDSMSLSIFSGRGGLLVLAAPENSIHITLADYALPFLEEYF